MDNHILSGLLAQYEQRRQQNAQEGARRSAEIARLHPDLTALMEKRHRMVLQSVMNLFPAENQDPEKIMAEYNQKIAAMLLDRGYPADYLSPIVQCETCRDTGYFYNAASQQEMCPCLKNAYHAALSKEGGELEKEHTFENFDASRFPADPLPGTDVTQREYMEIIRQKCLSFAENVPFGRIRTLLLHGGSGLGKTYLLHCIGHHARSRGVDTMYATAYDLLMALKNAYFSRDGFSRDGFSRTGESAQEYFDAQLLIIDDLGMEPLMEGVTVEQIYHLINARLTKGLYTAISTNLSRVELKQRYTERVSSRLLDPRTGLTIPFLGKDIRLMK